jgi:hypothetical protein
MHDLIDVVGGDAGTDLRGGNVKYFSTELA